MKRTICLLLSALLLLALCGCGEASSDISAEADRINELSEKLKSGEATLSSLELTDKVSDEELAELLDSLNGVEVSTDPEDEKLLVYIRDISKEKTDTFKAVFSNASCLEFRAGYYPGVYREQLRISELKGKLREGSETLESLGLSDTVTEEELSELLETFNGLGAQGLPSRLSVGIQDITQEKIDTFRAVFSSSPLIDFEEGYTIVPT